MTDRIVESGLIRRANSRNYSHAQHEPMRRVLRWMMANIAFRWLTRVDKVEGLENVPSEGAAILMINHIAFVDPVVVMGYLPRNIVPMAKAEVSKIPFWGIFPGLWGAIPVHRGELDREALTRALAVLAAGEIVLVAPEGTRHEALQDAKYGIAYLAYKSGAPIIPVAVEGTVGFPTLNRQRWAQPGAVVKFGGAFRFKPQIGRLPRETLRQMTEEAMYRLASLLPVSRRGRYADLNKGTAVFIQED